MGILLRYPGFRWLWLGQLLSQMGNAVFLIMALWEIQLRSPFLLSIAGLAMVVPSLLAMVGGVLVDRYDPRRLMLWTDALRGTAVAAGLAALFIPGSLVPVVIILLGLNSLGAALFGPAESVLVPWLVQHSDLPQANGIYSLTYQLSTALGAAIGGAAIAAIGIRLVFGLDLGSFWLSALAILLMMRTVAARPRTALSSSAPEAERGSAGGGGMLASFREGYAALKPVPGILPLMPIIVLTNFAFAAAFTMMPYWIHQALHANAVWYGLIDAGWAGGLVVGSLLTGYFGRGSLKSSLTILFGVQSLLFGAFAASSLPILSGLLLLSAGVANGIGNALFFTLLQRLIPDAVRGRAFGMLMTLLGVANPLGTLMAGLLLHVLPLYWSWAFAALVGLGMAVGIWVVMPHTISREPVLADAEISP